MLLNLLKQLTGRRKPRSAAQQSPVAPREHMLGEAVRLHTLGEHQALIEHCGRFLARHPDDTDALQFLATALVARGDLAAGIAALRRAVAAAPEPGEVQLALARMLARADQIPQALSVLQRAVAQPSVAEAACAELAALLSQLGRYDEAEACARTLLADTADSKRVQHALAGAMFEQGRVDESIAVLRTLVAAPDVDPAVHSDLLRALNYTDATSVESVFREHQEWADRHADRLAAAFVPHTNTRQPNRRLRVGLVSPHFRKHAVTFFLESVIGEFDPDQVELVLYTDLKQQDEYSVRLQSRGALWRSTVGLSDEAMAALVRQDRTDILVDLSGHTPGNRLLAFARRPAPVQATWNGYPNTTGMRAIDYRITDAYCDPPGATEHLHTERLLRLPGVYMSWQPPKDAPEVAPPPSRRNGYVTFASFNACYKLSATTLGLWSRILARLPTSRLLLLAVPPGVAERRVREALRQSGVDPRRLEFRQRVDHETFLGLHATADIALDPFPYHGTTTTCFSLWMGMPVVTLAGESHVSRVGVTVLSHVGLPRLVAGNGDDYIRIACDLANNASELAALRAELRSRMQASPLTDGRACARALQQAWRQAWSEWCTRDSP